MFDSGQVNKLAKLIHQALAHDVQSGVLAKFRADDEAYIPPGRPVQYKNWECSIDWDADENAILIELEHTKKDFGVTAAFGEKLRSALERRLSEDDVWAELEVSGTFGNAKGTYDRKTNKYSYYEISIGPVRNSWSHPPKIPTFTPPAFSSESHPVAPPRPSRVR